MNLQKKADHVFEPLLPFGAIESADLDAVKADAEAAPRRRSRICLHASLDDNPQEMIICLEPGTYIRPHKHRGIPESGLALRGIADAVFFDDDGEISDVWPMAPEGSGHRFSYRIAEPVFHCLVLRDQSFAFHEVAAGPFRRSNTKFADWSPPEENEKEVREYLAQLRDRIDRFLASGA